MTKTFSAGIAKQRVATGSGTQQEGPCWKNCSLKEKRESATLCYWGEKADRCFFPKKILCIRDYCAYLITKCLLFYNYS